MLDMKRGKNEDGRAALGLVVGVLALLVLIPAGCIGVRMLDSTAPAVKVTPSQKAIGRAPAKITVEADEAAYGVCDLRATLVQGALSVPLGEVTYPPNPWWRFWRRGVHGSALLEVEVGRERIPELKEGTATIRAEATNASWARFGKGRTTVVETNIVVQLSPPRLEVLSAQHYINQGGSECVVYRVSGSATVSGVRVGSYFFPGYPLPGGAAGTRLAIFAFPWDADAGSVPTVAARDEAGNEAVAKFSYKLFPKIFNSETVELSDDFLHRVVPEILGQSGIASQGDLLKDFLEINRNMRRRNAATLVELAAASRPERLWNGAFTQLGNSKVEASFADHRSYRYQGRIVDQQVHLGFDLAVTANHPVDAANDGVVVLAKYFGIYGNAVVIDHGLGLMTLYAHMSSIDVKEGEKVTRGQTLGRSGATGLAGGDHLHFSVLVAGIPVSPVEWWDAHWIHDRIEAKLAATASGQPQLSEAPFSKTVPETAGRKPAATRHARRHGRR